MRFRGDGIVGEKEVAGRQPRVLFITDQGRLIQILITIWILNYPHSMWITQMKTDMYLRTYPLRSGRSASVRSALRPLVARAAPRVR